MSVNVVGHISSFKANNNLVSPVKQQNNNKLKINYKDEALGIFGGVSSFLALKKILKLPFKKIVEEMMNNFSAVNANEVKQVANLMKKDLKDSNVSFVKVNQENQNVILDELLDDIKKSNGYKKFEKLKLGKLQERLIKPILEKAIQATSEGRNGFYFPLSNKIFTPENESPIILHEIGHAINANRSKFAKTIINVARVLPILTLAYLACYPISKISTASSKAKLKKKRNEIKKKDVTESEKTKRMNKLLNFEEKSINASEKYHDFIKNNIGKLLLITSVPMILEEALASYRGLKATKGIMKPEAIIKTKIGLGLALSTYVIGSVITASSAVVGKVIYDKITKPKTA